MERFRSLNYLTQRETAMSTGEQRDGQLGVVARVAGWTTRHRWMVLLGWVVALVAALGASHAVGTNFSNSLSLPGTQSQRAVDLLQRDFPTQSGDQDQIVFAASHGSVTAAAVRRRIAPVLARVARLPHVTAVVSPYADRGARQVAALILSPVLVAPLVRHGHPPPHIP